MAVPVLAKLSEVQAEFGAPSTAKLSEFNRGGTYVPDIPQNNSVPTSSASIKLSNLEGAVDYTPMVLVLSGDTTPNGACNLVATNCTARTTDIVCSMSSGIGPYTAVATHVSGHTFSPNLVNATESTVQIDFSKTNSGASATYSGVYKITATDAAGRVATSSEFNVTTTNTWTPTLVLTASGEGAPNDSCSAINAGCTSKSVNALIGTATGGVSPYTIGVAKHDGTTFAVTSTSTDNSRSFKFSTTSGKVDATYTGRYRLTVTDSSVPPQYKQTGLYRATNTHNYIPTLAITLNRTTAAGSCTGTEAACTAKTTEWVTATATGGEGDYTYKLHKRSGTTFTVDTNSNGRSFKFSTTNSTSSAEYTGKYYINVKDGSGQSKNSPDFTLSNKHTYAYSPLTITGSATLSSFFMGSSSAANGKAEASYVVAGAGGDGTYGLSFKVTDGEAFQTASLYVDDKTKSRFKLKLSSQSGPGTNNYGATWTITLTATRKGKTATKDVVINVRGQ